MSQAELATLTGQPKITINEIIKGTGPITSEIAMQFERVLGISARFWNNYEQHYRQYLTRYKEQERPDEDDYEDWVQQFSVKAMVKLGWIDKCDDLVDEVLELLCFFDLTSPKQWNVKRGKFEGAFRKTKAYKSGQGDLAAWLRRGELQAEAQSQNTGLAPFEREQFKVVLNQIRSLTLDPPEIFQPQVMRLCAEVGVFVVFVPQLPKSRLSGATRWLSPDKALIQLSLRYKTDDQLWFTFFHEAGHILLHDKQEIFLEDDDQSDEQEREANEFAANTLIPPAALGGFLENVSAGGHISKESIREFASELGIAPGIVVGRLQHDRYLPFTHCNDLKQGFEWVR